MRARLAKIIGLLMLGASLLGCAARREMIRSKEVILKSDLYALRRTIDEFTYDKKRAPQSLDELVQTGYLKQIPKDPMTNQTDWEPIMQVDSVSNGVEIGIADVHSASNQISTEGTPYNSW